MKVDGFGGGMMSGSGRVRRLNLTLPSSSIPESLSPSWINMGKWHTLKIKLLSFTLGSSLTQKRFAELLSTLQNRSGTK